MLTKKTLTQEILVSMVRRAAVATRRPSGRTGTGEKSVTEPTKMLKKNPIGPGDFDQQNLAGRRGGTAAEWRLWSGGPGSFSTQGVKIGS